MDLLPDQAMAETIEVSHTQTHKHSRSMYAWRQADLPTLPPPP